MANKSSFFSQLKDDFPAGIVVFLVALPLCLGIALASGAPLFSGIIAGIVGGTVVALVSGSSLGVSGPAAGLAIIVLQAIDKLGYAPFLTAVVIAGILQIALGFLRAGIIGYYFPNSVIKGMLSGIGIIIILKQIPHAFGYDKDYEGDLDFVQPDGQNTFTELFQMMDFISYGPLLIAVVSLAILILWEQPFMKKQPIFHWVQGPLVAVVAGIIFTVTLGQGGTFGLNTDQVVNIPQAKSISDFFNQFTLPDFTALGSFDIYVTAFTIAIVASLETLLCVEATDKLDPEKRITPTNRELIAQGLGNSISGLIGGLPITQVIVRSSANIQSGGKTKASAFIHGILILLSVIIIPGIINLIPLASLAAILFVVGYKLAKPAIFRKMFDEGWLQFLPFIVTILGIVFTNLLVGIGLGLLIAVFFILYNNYQQPYHFHPEDYVEGKPIRIELSEEVTFLNKAGIQHTLMNVPKGCHVIIDGHRTTFIHPDILEIFEDFQQGGHRDDLTLEMVNIKVQRGKDPIDKVTENVDGMGSRVKFTKSLRAFFDLKALDK